MKLKNPFTDKTRALFLDAQYTCFNCGGNGSNSGGIELNHTIGRESNSPLNGSPLCKECHSHVGHTDEEHKKLLNKTLNYLISQHYKLTEEDWDFIRKHHKMYANNT